jgi:hypothetical protein
MIYWDLAAVAGLLVSLALYVRIIVRWPRDRRATRIAYARIAYLGYAACAMVVGLFQLHLHVDGPDIFMVYGVFLGPMAIAGALAFLGTVAAKLSVTLWILGGATAALALLQALTSIGFIGAIMDLAAIAYVIIVLVACAIRRDEWWRAGGRFDA